MQGLCSVTKTGWPQCRVSVVLLKPAGQNAGSLLLKPAGHKTGSVCQNNNALFQVHKCQSTFYFDLPVTHPRCGPINIYIDVPNKQICFVLQVATCIEIVIRLNQSISCTDVTVINFFIWIAAQIHCP